jgi:hypothetical protein
MIHIAETVCTGSIEGFLSPADIEQLAGVMAAHLADASPSLYGAGRRTSIHEIPGHSAAQAMDVYEPAGRIEITTVPDAAEQILACAFNRARTAITRIMPSVTGCRPWTYVEYGPGQHITAHLDGIAVDPLGWPRQIAGISVVILPCGDGGGFYVETCSSDLLWDRRMADTAGGYAAGMWLARDGADGSAGWFREAARTRWSTNPAPGTALVYGSQLAHGTIPVREGRVTKFISWLTADSPASQDSGAL